MMSTEEEDLESLLRQVTGGDEQAFRELHRRTHAHLLSIARALLRRHELAEDVLQEVYVSVWRRAGQYDPAIARPMTWLITMTRHRAIDAIRSGRMDASAGSTPGVGDGVAMSESTAEHRVDRTRIGIELHALSAPQRQSLALAYFHGLSHSEVAERLDAPLGSVKVWIRRGLRHLRQSLEAAPSRA